ncbi:DinB family protein [Flavitalea flava]
MQATINHLKQIISNYSRRLKTLPEGVYSSKPHQQNWSKKEILGHLIDSAQNNIRRFVVAQYENSPTISYDQDKWVEISNYQHAPIQDLVTLWVLLNKHICRIWAHMSPEAAQRICHTPGPETRSIEWLAADYCAHLLHHLHQILDLDPITYP